MQNNASHCRIGKVKWKGNLVGLPDNRLSAVSEEMMEMCRRIGKVRDHDLDGYLILAWNKEGDTTLNYKTGAMNIWNMPAFVEEVIRFQWGK